MGGKSILEDQADAAAQALLARTQHWTRLSDEELETSIRTALRENSYESLWEALESYLALYNSAGSRVSSKTLKNYRYGLFKFLRFSERNEIEILSPRRDLGYFYKFYLLTDRSDRPANRAQFDPRTVNMLIGVARHFYRFLKWSLKISRNPFEGIHEKRLSISPWDKREAYSEDEIQRLVKGSSEKQRLVILLGAHAGLRISEICNVQVEDFDIQHATLHIPRGKGGSPRTVNLTPLVIKAVSPFISDSGYIFKENYRSLRKNLIALTKECKTPYKGFHSLRHYCGTALFLRTQDIEMVSRHLGHKSLEVTRTYIKPDDNAIRSELAKW